MSAAIGGWDIVRSGGALGGKCSVGFTEDVGTMEGRLPLASYCSPRDETEEFCLGKQRESREPLWAASLVFWQVWPVVERGVPAS